MTSPQQIAASRQHALQNDLPYYTGAKCSTCGCTTKDIRKRECINKCYIIRNRKYKKMVAESGMKNKGIYYKQPHHRSDFSVGSGVASPPWKPEVLKPWPVHDLTGENVDVRYV